MDAESDAGETQGLARRDLIRKAGAGLLVASGAVGLDARLAPAEGALVTPNPIQPRVGFGPFEVELVDFAAPPPTSFGGARAQLNFLYHRGDDSGALFVNDSRGKLWALHPDPSKPKLFLDLAALRKGAFLSNFYQYGLRSFAFHPNFAVPGAPGYRKFYTVSTETAASRPGGVKLFGGDFPVDHHNVVAEWQVDAATLATVRPGSHRELFRTAQWRPDHCADQLMFNPHGGSDFGNLYLTVGDGGNQHVDSDPYDLAQDRLSALGKILRIVPLKQGDGRAYGIPSGNPFVGNPKWLPEIYALGFRHPQNLSFDPGGAGAAICTDIGQKNVEEVNLLVKGGNYGWPAREGTFATNRHFTRQLYTLPADDAKNGYLYPVAQYDHDEGNLDHRSAIAGGFVYRGSAVPYLNGQYLCGDIVSGRIFHVAVGALALGHQETLQELKLFKGGTPTSLMEIAGHNDRVDLRFGQDFDGEVYILTKQDGKVRKMVPRP